MKRLVAIELPRIAVARPVPSMNVGGLVARGVADRLHHRLGAEIHVAVHDEGRDRLHVAVDDGLGDALLDARQRGRRGGHDHVAAQHQVGAAGGDAHGVRDPPASGARRTWLITAPFFCARPVKSSTVQPLPSRCAAMPISAPTVMTPVPPMPVTRMP